MSTGNFLASLVNRSSGCHHSGDGGNELAERIDGVLHEYFLISGILEKILP